MYLYVSEYKILIETLKKVQFDKTVERNFSLGCFEVINKLNANAKQIKIEGSKKKVVRIKIKNKRDIEQCMVVINRVLEKESIELDMDKITVDFILSKVLIGLYDMLPSSKV